MPSSDQSQGLTSNAAGPSRANGGSAADQELSHQDSRYVAGEMAQLGDLVFDSAAAKALYAIGDPPRAFNALKEIARGEQTASMLEANLTSLEAKLDAMLAAIEKPVAEASEKKETKEDSKGESKS